MVSAGGWEGSLPMEQRPCRESDQAKPQSHIANHLPCVGEQREKPLESSGAEPDPERAKDLLWCGSGALRGVPSQIPRRWGAARGDQEQAWGNMEAVGGNSCRERHKHCRSTPKRAVWLKKGTLFCLSFWEWMGSLGLEVKQSQWKLHILLIIHDSHGVAEVEAATLECIYTTGKKPTIDSSSSTHLALDGWR